MKHFDEDDDDNDDEDDEDGDGDVGRRMLRQLSGSCLQPCDGSHSQLIRHGARSCSTGCGGHSTIRSTTRSGTCSSTRCTGGSSSSIISGSSCPG